MIHLLRSADLWFLTVQGATSLLLVALGLYLPYRAGILNLGAEGIMLFGCFGSVLAAAKTGGSTAVGVAAGAGIGLLAGALFGLLTITFRANGLVVGIGLNFLAAGATATATTALYGVAGTISTPDLTALPGLTLPGIDRIPWLGDVLSGQSPLALVALVLAVVMAWWLANTQPGLRLRVTGSRPDIADVGPGAGVAGRQWCALLAGGALMGLGGAQLALAAAAQFSPDMTSGRGFIAVALVLVAGVRCWLLLPLAVAFALFDALGVNLQSLGLPSELSGILPYAAIVVALVVPRVVGTVRADGRLAR